MKNEWLVDVIKDLERQEFCGKVTLNFHKGKVPRIKKEEDILEPDSSLNATS